MVTRGQSGALDEVILVLVPPWLCHGPVGGWTLGAVPHLYSVCQRRPARVVVSRGGQGLWLLCHLGHFNGLLHLCRFLSNNQLQSDLLLLLLHRLDAILTDADPLA